VLLKKIRRKVKEEEMSLFPAYSNDKTECTSSGEIGNYFNF